MGYPLQYSWASLVTQLVKNRPDEGDLDSILGLGRSLGEGKGYSLQYSGLKNSMDYIAHGVAKSRTRLSDITSLHLMYYRASMIVGKESAGNAGDLGLIPGLGRSNWKREELLTPVFWPGEFHELYSLWGHKESDTIEPLSLS